ncbi:MAG: acyl-CoA dehydratase activase, partial [Candidatus Humimicrobiaceae bacterium]
MTGDFYIGYDIGAISVNRAVIDSNKNIIDVLPYSRHYGEPVGLVVKDIEALAKRKDISKISGIAFTGSGGKIPASLLHADFINEIEAIITSIKYFYCDIKTVIEIGGQDSKFIDLVAGDFAMNELCAAGTGSFLDQQASRFNLTIEEFAELALKSKSPSTIAGRCSVFAKSDMIHLQQEAAKDEDIALGLCYAMTRSFKSGIVKGKNFQPPIIFCGGVSFNKAMSKAFEDILKEQVVIPEHRESIGAIGAALSLALKNNNQQVNLEEAGRTLSDYLKNFKYKKETFKPLILDKSKLPTTVTQEYDFNGKKIDAFIGVDVGSISTNVVAIDRNKKLIAKCYLRTAGRPIEAVRKGIEIIGNEIGGSINVKAVGTTGSGRYLIGDLVGADTIINEITAQATAAINIDNTVDTIFEIGGQDSKYISLEKGVVVDFEMNKICAAGTGSFLEEQAERFDIEIEDFGDRALKAASPLNLGERCTVFMETNVYSHYQNGAGIEDILAGLAYSITINYINRVVGRKKIGNKIFFQGAVAYNKAVVAAFENYLGKEIIVPENHEVTGAIGTAIATLENEREETNFRGFSNIANIKYSQSSFECGSCPNMCEIKKVTFEGSKPLFYGGRCEKYEKVKSSENGLADLFAEREELLLGSYKKPDKESEASVKKIGIPFTMLTYEFYPFWNAFFSELGFEVVLSDKTNKKIINDGLGLVVAETCFPMKAVIGHVQNLLDKKVDYIFIPSIRDMPCKDNKIEGARTGSYPCPFVQGMSTMVKASMNIDQKMLIDPLINFSFKEYLKENQLRKLAERLGKKGKIIKKAISHAQIAQQKFYTSVTKKGMEALSRLGPEETAAVIVSRPYNSCDSSISMDIPRKLREIGMQAIPLDYLPLENIDLFERWPNMYWEFGDRIMGAAEIIKKDKRLYPVYITNFGCGPDSFIMQYFEREMDRPFLKIEVDEHTAGAGVITRCEAFSDSLKNIKNLKEFHKFKYMSSIDKNSPPFKRKGNRTIYIPYMGDGAYAVRASFKFSGINAEVMQSDHETLEIGRRHTLGKECYPFIITTGDILKTLKHNDPKKAAFLMPMTHGPCRFGQYNKMQKIIIKEQGYGDVPIIAPGVPESSQFYKEYDMQGSKGTGLLSRAMAGIFAVDYLNKFLRHVRPFEVNKGETDSIYQAHLNEICQIIENKENMKVLDKLSGVLELAKKDFVSIKRKDEAKPVIGIVGEIYVRNHPFSNNEIIRKIEELGGVVEIPDFGEWSDHTNA